MSAATKVGLFVFLFFVMLIGSYMLLGKSFFGSDVNHYFISFENATGINTGARVTIAGVPIGQVEDIQLKSPKEALVKVSIRKNVHLPINSHATFGSSLIGVGEQPIEIQVPPTQSGESEKFLSPGSQIKGMRVSVISTMMPEAEHTLKELNTTLKATRELLGSKTILHNLEALIGNVDKAALSLERLMTDSDYAVIDARQGLKRTLEAGEHTLEQISKLTKDLSKTVTQVDTADISAKTTDALETAKKLLEELRTFINSPTWKEALVDTSENMRHITKELADKVGTVTKNIEQMTKNGSLFTEKAIILADKTTVVADEAKELIGTVNEKVGGLFNSRFRSRKKIKTQAGVAFEPMRKYLRTDVQLSVPISKHKINLGFFDAFASNQLILQLQQPLGNFANLRYGAYAGRPGIGVDLKLAPKFYLKGDIFGFNNTRFDLRAQYEFSNGIFGWVELDRVFQVNSPAIGIGIRR